MEDMMNYYTMILRDSVANERVSRVFKAANIQDAKNQADDYAKLYNEQTGFNLVVIWVYPM